MRTAGAALLIGGYPTAALVGTRLLGSFRTRQSGVAVVFGAATASVAAGWALRGRPGPAAINVVILAGLMVAWRATGRRGR